MGRADDPARPRGIAGRLPARCGRCCPSVATSSRPPSPPSTPTAARAEDTDWARIAGLYDVLAQAAPGPVVEVNRAVAHGRAHGALAGLAVLDAVGPTALGDSPLAPSVRGDLLERAGRHVDAASAFAEAAALTRNEGERGVLLRRAEENRTLGG